MDVFVDLDPAVYACGFASQKSTYQLVYEETANVDKLETIMFSADDFVPAGTKMKEWIKARGEEICVVDKQKLVIAEPLAHCLRIVRTHIDTVVSAICSHFSLGRDAVTFNYFLSGSTNYRFSIAKQLPYKGNRLPESRPFHFTSIRQYLEENWNPSISVGNEADDAISIAAEQAKAQHKDTCIVSIDKDLDQISGWHYNPDKKVFYQQDRDSALLYLYQQILSGDSTDNIPGCYKVGTEGAKGRIAEWSEGFEEIGLEQEKTLWENIVATYRASQAKRGCPYASVDASEVALETARLVYIQRALNELFNPPGVAFGRTDIL